MNLYDLLKRFGNGTVSEELEQNIRKAAKECVLKDAKAKVTLTLEFVPNEESGVIISSRLAIQTPSQTHARTFLFLGEDGSLEATNPDQANMRDLRQEFAATNTGGGDE